MNGRGYPLGVDRKNITPYAKILSVVDVYDTLVGQSVHIKRACHSAMLLKLLCQ